MCVERCIYTCMDSDRDTQGICEMPIPVSVRVLFLCASELQRAGGRVVYVYLSIHFFLACIYIQIWEGKYEGFYWRRLKLSLSFICCVCVLRVDGCVRQRSRPCISSAFSNRYLNTCVCTPQQERRKNFSTSIPCRWCANLYTLYESSAYSLWLSRISTA